MTMSLSQLPDELLLHVLFFLDVPELLALSRTCRRLRALTLDPLLHRSRRRHSQWQVQHLYPRRPAISTLQPPTASIYLTRTHVAARRLHWSLVCIRLNRNLARRPKLSTLISTNIVPKECCKVDRRSGEFLWGTGVSGGLIERKRQVEREKFKEGLRVWLERKARDIKEKKREGGVGVLVWRFSRRLKLNSSNDRQPRDQLHWHSEKPKKEKVSGLKRFWEGLSGDVMR
ncbi:hypothetical protein K431DRAFT_143135 [Polychaeton citri CBS 116435]|uniref:F-box domain-containing protein n=1 Tax=Polychaeton citri CBS 116435 TaxID=1314669 RepID=A0A9P4Q467_9PEZI|nr:hypothetical protein K431DRAFT_143135 [Polychaeton citri CBS 116435]